jgi:hypothetical protein
MSKTHLFVPDPHAHPDFHNLRADWLGELIREVKPDVVINAGDAADLASLSAYDKGKASFFGRSYEKDIQSHLDFQDRMWQPIRKAKKKMPRRIILEGNHEHRIKTVLEREPELAGAKYGLSFKDLDFNSYYDDVVEYEGQTPGIIEVDGVNYAHYFVSGVMGRAAGGMHHAYSLISKQHMSCTQGHSHLLDFSSTATSSGKRLTGLVAGVFQDYDSPWAGGVNRLWWRGVVVKRNVEDGVYDPQFISIDALRKEYGQK